MAKIRVSDVDFVKACLTSKSIDELATATGLAPASANVRATKLRKAGVNLPVYARKRKATDVEALNALVTVAEQGG